MKLRVFHDRDSSTRPEFSLERFTLHHEPKAQLSRQLCRRELLQLAQTRADQAQNLQDPKRLTPGGARPPRDVLKSATQAPKNGKLSVTEFEKRQKQNPQGVYETRGYSRRFRHRATYLTQSQAQGHLHRYRLRTRQDNCLC